MIIHEHNVKTIEIVDKGCDIGLRKSFEKWFLWILEAAQLRCLADLCSVFDIEMNSFPDRPIQIPNQL